MVWSAPFESDSDSSEEGGGSVHSEPESPKSPCLDICAKRSADPWHCASSSSASQDPHNFVADLDPGLSRSPVIQDHSESPPRSPPKNKRRRVDSCPLACLIRLPTPKFEIGTAWWAGPLWTGISGHIARMPSKPRRAMVLECMCCGTCGEAVGVKAPAAKFQLVAPRVSGVGLDVR